MSSLRIRFFRLASKLLIRRRYWGKPRDLALRARRVFGSPPPYSWLRSFGVTVSKTGGEDPAGEWIVPHAKAEHVILYRHGGGYVSGSPSTHRPITAALARLTPATVFAPA